MNNRAKLAVAGTLALASIQAAHAAFVDFESYSAAEIVGATSTWTGNAGNFAVEEGKGNGGKALVSQATAVSSNNVYYSPSAAEIGGNWTTDKLVTYSFDLSIIGHTGASTNIERFYIGESSTSNHAVELVVRRSGALALNGTNFTTLSYDTFYTLKAVVDYTSNTYDFFVGTTQYADDSPFDGAVPTGSYPRLRLNMQGADAGNRIALDNIAITVPEPGVASLLGATCVMGLMARRRAHS